MQKSLLEKIEKMRIGGKKLGVIKVALQEMSVPGVSFESIESSAQTLIAREGAVPSFSTVSGYKWATCITKNSGCCHGIPKGNSVLAGDIITIDVGLIYQGYHLDTSITFYVSGGIPIDPKVAQFLTVGNRSKEVAIAQAVVGNSVYDVSKAMQQEVESHGYSCVYQLTGHAIGRELHEDPQIPCLAYRSDKKHKLYEGQTIAIESMLAMGNARLKLGKDGWTYETVDGSLTGMFEDTVLVTAQGPQVLTTP